MGGWQITSPIYGSHSYKPWFPSDRKRVKTVPGKLWSQLWSNHYLYQPNKTVTTQSPFKFMEVVILYTANLAAFIVCLLHMFVYTSRTVLTACPSLSFTASGNITSYNRSKRQRITARRWHCRRCEDWKKAGEERWGQGLDSDDDREGPKRHQTCRRLSPRWVFCSFFRVFGY